MVDVLPEDKLAAYWLTALVSSADDAIISKTLEGIITSWNRGAQQIFGYTTEEAIGKPILILIPPERHSEEAEIISRIKAGERVEHYETVRVRKDGSLVNISLTISPIKTPEGKIIGASKIARDITRSKQAEEQIRQSEERYRLLFNSIDQGFCVFEVLFDETGKPSDYRFLEVNPVFEKMTGIPNNEALSEKTARQLVPNLEDKWIEIYGRIALTGESVRFVERSDAMNRWFDVYAFRVGGAKSRKVALLFNDITDRKRGEERLRESEENLRYTVELNPQVPWTATPEGRIESFNDRWLEMTGLTYEEALGDGWLRIQHPDDLQTSVDAWMHSIRTGDPYDIEHRIRLADGSYGWVRSRAFPRRDERGSIIRWYGTTEDIHQHKQADENLRESQRMLRLAMGGSRMGYWSRDLATETVYWSPELEKLFGLPVGSFAGNLRGFRDYVYNEDKEIIALEIERAIAEHRDYIIEFRFHHGDGTLHWMEGRGQAVYAPDGTPIKVYGIGIDITERKRDELDRQFLLELGEKIRFADFSPEKLLNEITKTTCKHLNAARCLFVEINEAENRGRVRHEYFKKGMSPVAGEYKISDYSRQTLEGIRRGQIIVNNDARRDPRTADIYQTTYEPYNEQAYISIPLFANGRWDAIFWVSDDKPRVWTTQEIAFLETVGERTWLAIEKLRNDEALRLSEERLRLATEAADIYSWEADVERQIIVYSSNTEQVMGFTMPKSIADGMALIHEEDRQMIARNFERAVREQSNFSSEFRIVNPLTREIAWQSAQGIFIKGAGDSADLLVGITQNITSRKQAEREREELLRREQAARRDAEEASRSKDEFLATVSHELRTPLNAIMGWSQMLSSGVLNQSDAQRAIETIYRNAKSQAQLIEDILDVSRIVTGKLRIEPKPTALAPIIQTAVESLRPAIEAKNIRLQLRLDFESRMVCADADRIQQVVWNLLSNAIKFTPEKGQVTIKLESDSSQTKIVVSDTGTGINPDFLPFVFDRFRQADGSSTRKHGGLGLGLSIVRHLVELHGGRVEVESQGKNAGTTFTVRLPQWEPPVNKIEDFKFDELLSNGSSEKSEVIEDLAEVKGLRVLIVDDEIDTLELLAAVLRRKGVEVMAKTRVSDAFETIIEWQPDIIVSDIAMPEEDGYSLIKKLRDLPPDKGGTIPAIALTAYVGVKERAKVLESGFQMYVPKPVEPTELLSAIASFSFELR
ncbi:MAG: PAS domain S-box protein [Acidobacteriota bacterium]|nr:PAS domain S-box protein [Acidobacteriota bacterium]